MKRLSTHAWSRLRPGAAIYQFLLFFAVVDLMRDSHPSVAAIVCVAAAPVLGVAAFLLVPRETMPLFTATELQAYLPWGVAIVMAGLVLLELVPGDSRYLWAGAAAIGMLYVVVGLAARRWLREDDVPGSSIVTE